MKKYFYHFIIVSLLLPAAACNKSLLEPSSGTSLSDAVAFKTADRIANQINGLYRALKQGNLLGSRYIIYGDIRAENFLNETNNLVTGNAIWNFTVTGSDGEITGTWDDAYSAINQANVFLDGMANGGSKVVGDKLSKQFIGEAKFIRALTYYCLLQLYVHPITAGDGPALPLRLTAIKGPGFNNLARSKTSEVYKQILTDLNDAEASLPSDYGDASLNTTRAHVNTAIALKTRVYLSMNDYANVITEANKIVSANAPFSAQSGVAHALQNDIRSVFSTYTTKESIFSMPFTSAAEAPATQAELANYYLSPDDGGTGEYSLNPNGIVADALWTGTDVRRTFVDTSSSDNKLWLTKYPSGSPYLDWAPVLRYSEVLLNLAEARTRANNTVDAQAVALLNAVRHRSDPATTYTTAAFANAAELITAILKERDIEFLGEGLRNGDIMRLNLPFPAKGSVAQLPPTAASYIFPAPSTEILYNNLW